MLQPRLGVARRVMTARSATPAPESRRLAAPIVQPVLPLMELMANGTLLLRRKLRLDHQPLDEVTIAQFSREAPGRNMRLRDQAVLFKAGQFVRMVAEASPGP